MKLECIKDRLREGVAIAERLVSKNTTLPVLGLVVLEAQNSLLSIKATNLEVGVEIHLPVKVMENGLVALKGTVLNNFLSNLPKEDKIKLEVVNNNLTISTNYSSTLIKCQPPEDFPIIPTISGGVTFSLPAVDLVKGLRAVLYAAALSDIKPEITSVYIYRDSNNLVFVATDAFRLAEKKVNLLGKKIGADLTMIVPLKNATELIRLFEGSVDDLEIRVDKHQLSVYTPTLHFTSRLIDGVFPDYRQLLPKETSTEAVLDREELLQAIKLAGIFSDRFNQVDLKIIPAEKIFEITSRNQDVGESTVRVSGEFQGAELSLSLNVRYLAECFPALTGSEITIRGVAANRPLIINSVGDASFTYLLMPLQR